MSDYASDAARWEHFTDNLEDWQNAVVDVIDALYFKRHRQKITLSDIIEFAEAHGVRIADVKWVKNYMAYLSVRGLADPVLGGWILKQFTTEIAFFRYAEAETPTFATDIPLRD